MLLTFAKTCSWKSPQKRQLFFVSSWINAEKMVMRRKRIRYEELTNQLNRNEQNNTKPVYTKEHALLRTCICVFWFLIDCFALYVVSFSCLFCIFFVHLTWARPRSRRQSVHLLCASSCPTSPISRFVCMF